MQRGILPKTRDDETPEGIALEDKTIPVLLLPEEIRENFPRQIAREQDSPQAHGLLLCLEQAAGV